MHAGLSPRHRALLTGIELADSVASDGHKWLIVPYDCGFIFVRQPDVWRRALSASAAYLNTENEPPTWNALDYVPEMSLRIRALAARCALRAAGQSGIEEIVSRSIANAARSAGWVSRSSAL